MLLDEAGYRAKAFPSAEELLKAAVVATGGRVVVDVGSSRSFWL
jgi:FixJ family two-component response regulator